MFIDKKFYQCFGKVILIKTLAVIPARGGSKGIKQKNLRLLNGKPLLFYVINNALQSKTITHVVVTSEDKEILEFASNYPIYLRERPVELAGDEVTLDPVVYDAYQYMENTTGIAFDLVITLQPTSPLLRPETIDSAVHELLREDVDSVISVTDDTHLMWTKKGDKYLPLYSERKNRQWLPKVFKETGAFLITRTDCISCSTRLGKKILAYPIAEDEGLDIDTINDWLAAEAYINRLKFVFIVNGNTEIGMGHVYRALTLADSFLGHEIFFLTFASDKAALDLIKSNGYSISEIKKNDIVNKIKEIKPDIIINDILDTDANYIEALKSTDCFIINFEDLGTGSEKAHLVFNALYELSNPPSHHRYGHQYECLDRRFLFHNPIKFKEQAENLLVTFGGVDQNNLTLRVVEVLPAVLNNTSLKKVNIVLGPAYQSLDELKKKIDTFPQNIKSRIHVIYNSPNMALIMKEADIGITSNGRTVYEMAAMGIPTISISQNDRETLHLFSRYHKGIEYLGIAPNVTSEKIYQKLTELVNDHDKRRAMYHAQIKSNVRQGLERVNYEILYEYKRWKKRWKNERDNNWENNTNKR